MIWTDTSSALSRIVQNNSCDILGDIVRVGECRRYNNSALTWRYTYLSDIFGVVYGIKNQLEYDKLLLWGSFGRAWKKIYGDVGRDNDRKPVGIQGHPVFKQVHLKHCWGKSQGRSHTAKPNQGLRCSHLFITGIYIYIIRLLRRSCRVSSGWQKWLGPKPTSSRWFDKNTWGRNQKTWLGFDLRALE